MKLKAEFSGVRDGDIYPTKFQAGDECPPELEAGAHALGALDGVPALNVDAEDSDAKLSVAEIRETLTTKGIAFDPKAKKADLLALLPKD